MADLLVYRRLRNGEYLKVEAEPLSTVAVLCFGQVNPENGAEVLWLWEEPLALDELALVLTDLQSVQARLGELAAVQRDVGAASLADAELRLTASLAAQRALEAKTEVLRVELSILQPRQFPVEIVHVEAPDAE